MKQFFIDIKRFLPYVYYAAKSRLKSNVSGSYLSWLWFFLEPLGLMLVYMFIVVVVFGTSEPFFPVFVFTGISTWRFFNKAITSSTRLIRSNRSIINKIYMPKYILTIIEIVEGVIRLMFSYIIVFVMMLVLQVPITLNVLYFVPLLLLLLLVTFSLSLLVMHLGAFVSDLSNAISIIMRFLFYLSGIFYSIPNKVPPPLGTVLLHSNPIGFIIDEFRNVLLFGKSITFMWYGIWLGISLLMSVVGIYLVQRNERLYTKVA